MSKANGTRTLRMLCAAGAVVILGHVAEAGTTGACCFADGTCIDMTGADCAHFHGAYQGDGTECTTTVCPCAADLDGGADIAFGDLLVLFSNWGPCPGCPADLTGDDQVDIFDLLLVLSSWGPCA